MLKISVVTVSFNQGNFIEDNIKSVLDQNYPNFEHIIIDAGSTDGTLDILKSYPHLIWTSEPDRGQSDGLNKGFRKTTGDIIFWINSDDMVAPGAFKAVNDFFEKNPDKSVITGNQIMIGKNGETIKRLPPNVFDLDYLLNEKASYVQQNSTVFRKSVLDNVGLLDESFHYTMDLELFIRIAKQYKCYALPEDIALFRLWEGAKTATARIRFYRDSLRARKMHGGRMLSSGSRWLRWQIFREYFIRIEWLHKLVKSLKAKINSDQ